MPRESAQICAMGLDTGYAHTGVALVTDRDTVLYTAVIQPEKTLEITAKILEITRQIEMLVAWYHPVVIGIEIYTAPNIKVRAMNARHIAYHQFLIGACFHLGATLDPAPGLALLEAVEWMRQLTGLRNNQPIGKEAIALAVTRRTGYVFTHNSGGHQSDAAGIALVALDNYTLNNRA